MTNNILNDADQIKAILVKTKGTIAQKLLAILDAAGLDDVAELAGLLEVTERYVRKTRNQSSENGTRVPEPEFHERNQSSAIKKVSPTPLSKNNTSLELPSSSTSSTVPRAKVAATPLPIDPKVLEKRITEACNGSLASLASYPGLMSMATPIMWLDHGADLERDVIPTLTALGQKYHGKGIKTWDFFNGAIADAKAKRERGLPEPSASVPKAIDFAEQTRGVVRYAQPAADQPDIASLRLGRVRPAEAPRA